MPTIQCLPEELLLYVFVESVRVIEGGRKAKAKGATTLTAVCRIWRRIASDDAVWKEVVLAGPTINQIKMKRESWKAFYQRISTPPRVKLSERGALQAQRIQKGYVAKEAFPRLGHYGDDTVAQGDAESALQTSMCARYARDKETLASAEEEAETRVALEEMCKNRVTTGLRDRRGRLIVKDSPDFAWPDHYSRTVWSCSKSKVEVNVYRETSRPALGAPYLYMIKPLYTLNTDASCLTRLGEYLFSGSLDGFIEVWDARSGDFHWSWDTHAGAIHDLCAIPPYVFSASADSTIGQWNRSGQSQATLRGHTAAVSCLITPADHSLLISGSLDQTVRVWNWESSAQLRCIPIPIPIWGLQVLEGVEGEEQRPGLFKNAVALALLPADGLLLAVNNEAACVLRWSATSTFPLFTEKRGNNVALQDRCVRGVAAGWIP